MISTDPVGYYFPPWMLWQNRGMWSRRNFVCSDMSVGIPNVPITSWSVSNIHNRVLCCKSISINYDMHGWFQYWWHATGWFLLNKWFAGCGNVKLEKWPATSRVFTFHGVHHIPRFRPPHPTNYFKVPRITGCALFLIQQHVQLLICT